MDCERIVWGCSASLWVFMATLVEVAGDISVDNPSYTMVIVIEGDESLSHERMLMCQQGVEQKNEFN